MPKTKLFRIDYTISEPFMSTAELLNQDHTELLSRLMKVYVESVKESIVDLSNKHPTFSHRYPFVK